MKTDAILKADVLDIIFENRNKSYGAYSLRKFYNNRLYKALGLMGLLVIVLCSFTFFTKAKTILISREYSPETVLNTPPKDEIKPEKPKVLETKQPEATPAVNTNDDRVPVITDHPVQAPIETFNPNAAMGDKKIDVPTGNGEGLKVGTPIGGSGGKDTGTAVVKAIPVDIVTPIDNPDVMPAYPGGMEALRKYLEKNLVNPEEKEEGETITVKVKFVVGYDGVLKNLEIVEDGGASYNNEVLRVVKKMKPWIPGKTKGENVSVYYTIPIKFTTTS
jgi:periplasmic protein TonB